MNHTRHVLSAIVLSLFTFCIVPEADAHQVLRTQQDNRYQLSVPSLIEQAYSKREIDINQWALYHAYALKDPGKLPKEYRSEVPEECGTWILNEIHRSWNKLSESTRFSLIKLGWTPFGVLSRPTGLDSIRGTTHFLVHYSVVPGDTNGVSTFDGDANGTPDYIDTVLTTLEYVWNYEISTMGYTPPPPDNGVGGDDRYDVYVIIPGIGILGSTQPEQDIGDNPNSPSVTETHAFTSFILHRNNFIRIPLGNLRRYTSTAHEFYHMIEVGYDAFEMDWMAEATAKWSEDEVYNDINSGYVYLPSWFQYPWIALDENSSGVNYDGHWYGSWIFFRYLSEHLIIGGRDNIRRILERVVAYDNKNGDYSFNEIGDALAERGTNFTKIFREFTAANATLTIGPFRYKEGANYPMVARTVVQSDTTIQDTVYRHASGYYQVVPAMLPSCAKNFTVTFSPIDTVAHLGAQVVLCKNGRVALIPFEKSLTLPADTAPDSLFIVVLNFDFPGTTQDYKIQIQSQLKGSKYTLTDLGKIGDFGAVNAVNNLGNVVGTLSSNFGSFTSYTPVKWVQGSLQSLGSNGGAYDINRNDEVVGYVKIPFGNHAYLWQPSGSVSIDTVTAGQSAASAINDSGFAVGTAKFPFNGGTESNSQPFIWKNNQMTKLPLFPDTNAIGGTALDINKQKQVLGQIWVAQTTFPFSVDNHAALWSGGGGVPQDLGVNFIPQRLNDAGQYVGNAGFGVTFDGTTSNQQHPALGSGASYSDLGTPDQLEGSGIALGINNLGDVVGWTVTAAGWHAFLYKDGVMEDLNSLLPFGACWTLREATAISDSGHIVGIGRPVSDGLLHGFLLTPTSLTGVSEHAQRPSNFALNQNYPNPFNPKTDISYQISDSRFVTLTIFDVLGREVATLVNEKKEPGEYSVTWDAGGFASGVYFYQIQAGQFIDTKKLILIR